MLANRMRCATIACVLAILLSMPAASEACGCLDWLFGGCRTPCAAPCASAQTTYTPPYYATEAPAYAAPACGCTGATQVAQYAPYVSYYRPAYLRGPVTTYYCPQAACNTCAVPATACYAPSVCNPCAASTTTYYPAAGCSTCAMPVTAYRPVLAMTQQVRIIPYTSYRMPYMSVAYVGYAPACAPCAAPVAPSCGSCSSVGYAATCEAPSCSLGQPAVSGTYITPSTPQPSLQPMPITSPQGCEQPAITTQPQTTFQGQTQPPTTFQGEKPATEENKPSLPDNTTAPGSGSGPGPDLKPVPSPGTQLNSMPDTKPIDPENRTTLLPVRQAVRLVARPITAAQPAAEETAGGWRQSRD
jgi:hypothetical protein